MKISNVSYIDFLKKTLKEEGIVLLGTGGDLNNWLTGVSKILCEEGIAPSSIPEDLFESAYLLETTGGRHDLALSFKSDSKLDPGKMAMWRLRFGNCSWISDYKVNYANHHGFTSMPNLESLYETDEDLGLN